MIRISLGKEILRIRRSISSTRLWRYRHKYSKDRLKKKKEGDKRYYNKIKSNKNFLENKRQQLQNWRNSGSRFNPVFKRCKLCKNTFRDLSSIKNKLFCKNKCKQQYFYNKNKKNGMNMFYKKSRRAREKQVYHNFSLKEWNKKLLSTDGICLKCNKNIGIDNLTLDHIVPISKAPKRFIYTINDIQPLCFQCNRIKNNKMEVTI